MSWDLTIRGVQDAVGNLQSVQKIIADVFPSARFGHEPSGIEKVRVAEAQGVKFPPILLESMISQPAMHIAELETDGIFLRFHFGFEEIVKHIGLEVRGEGNPFP